MKVAVINGNVRVSPWVDYAPSCMDTDLEVGQLVLIRDRLVDGIAFVICGENPYYPSEGDWFVHKVNFDILGDL